MSKTVYVRYQYVTRHENLPGSLGDTIRFNGFDTGLLRYYEIGGNSFPGDRDYIELSVAEMTFAAQNTQQLVNAPASETGFVHNFPLWITRSVPDNFVIPTVPKADLRVTLKSVTPATVADDGTLNLKYQVFNSGTASAGQNQLAFYVSTDAKIDKNDFKLLWGDEPPLSAKSSTGDISFPLPLMKMIAGGKYYIGAIIDNDGRVSESNEANNVSNAIAITVTGENLAPVPGHADVHTKYETAVNIDVLAVATDPNPGDRLSYVPLLDEYHAPRHGEVRKNSDGTMTYIPNPGFVGTDVITYELSDNHGGENEGYVTVTVYWNDVVVNKGTLPQTYHKFWNFEIPEGTQGTYTFNFKITKPTTLHSVIKGGAQFDATLYANAGNVAPTLGLGPDRRGTADHGYQQEDPDSDTDNQQVIDDPLMPGSYSMVITRHSTASGDYQGSVEMSLSPDEAGNNVQWAAPISVGATVKGVVNNIDNKDVYKFTLTKPSSVLVSLAVDGMAVTEDGVPPIHYEIMTRAGSTDYYHVLESHTDAASRWVDTAYTAADLNDPANNPLDPGDYYIVIYHPVFAQDMSTPLPPSNYSVTVNAWADNAANRLLTTDFGSEGPKSANVGDLTGKSYRNHDFLGLADPNDFYVFTLTQRSSVTIQLTQSSKDVSMNLDLSEAPYVVRVLDGVRDGAGSRALVVTLDPGLYSLRAYTDTEFHDPGGTAAYGSAPVFPYGGGAYYDLTITAKSASSARAIGSGGDDDFLGGDGNDVFSSGAGNDILRGMAGSDNLNGGAGDDVLVGGPGADILAGGGGNDTLSYAGDRYGVTATLVLVGKVKTVVVSNGHANGHAQGDTATGFSNLTGGYGADHLSGDASNNTIEGGGGGDVLVGGGGFDTVSYSSADDPVSVDLSTSIASGDDAEGDSIAGFSGIKGGQANDQLTGDANANIIDGLAGNDTLFGAAGNDTLRGGMGDDTIEGGAGNDILAGGSGGEVDGDTLSYAHDASGVTVSLAIATAQNTFGEGIDKVSGFENLTGGLGNDMLTGDKNPNAIAGGNGDDLIFASLGGDRLDGGRNVDTVSYGAAPAGISLDLSDYKANYLSGKIMMTDILINIENVIGSKFADAITGHNGANVLDGDAGDDLITGEYGNDTIDGGAGKDTLAGGDGDDTYFADALDTIVEKTNEGIDTVNASITFSLGAEVENLILLGKAAINGTGNALANSITGNDANNILSGGLGNDVLSGGLGNDTLIGDGGADSFDGGTGIADVVSYAGSIVAVTANLADDTANAGDALGDTFEGVENLIGGSANDILTGDGNANKLEGRLGDDTLDGGGGDDILTGGGTTALPGKDTVSYDSAGAAVTVNLALTAAQKTGGSGTDTLSGFENLIGSDYADILTGDSKANKIEGGGGDDVIIGGTGADTLIGNSGNDRFHFLRPTDGADTISDFTSGSDKIVVFRSGFGIGSKVDLNGIGDFDFAQHYFVSRNVVAATEAKHGQFLYDNDDGKLFWDSDGTGIRTATLIAELGAGTTLTASDFELK